MARAKGKRYEVVAPELGTIGLKQTGGVVRQEFLRELQGQRGMQIYREMRDNSAIIGAALNAIEMLARQVCWEVEPPEEATDEEKKRTERIEDSLHDMTVPWTETVASHLSMLPFGYSVHEIVFKKCQGEKSDPRYSSKYDDNMISWAKLPIRPQETLWRWNFDENGQTLGVWQRPPLDFKGERYIPASKYLNFHARAANGNPEGISILRNAYFSWYFAKRIQELEGIGIERDLAGLPMFRIPAECMVEGASGDLAGVFDMAKTIVQNVRNDDEAGLVIPSAIKDGQQLYDFKLLSTGGTRSVDTNEIINRLERRMAQTLLADFILLGHEGVGSYSLSSDKTQLFAVALGGFLDAIADVYNLQALPQLMRVNGWPADRAPKLCHGDIESQDLARVGDFINKMVGANIITADDELEEFARKLAEIPPRNPNSKPREKPGATNTKPEGGAPDAPKPKEENPGKPPTAPEDAAAEAAYLEERAKLVDAATRAPVPQPAPVVNLYPTTVVEVPAQAAPTVNVEAAAAQPPIVIPPALVEVKPTTIVERASDKVLKVLRDAKGLITGAVSEEK